MNQKRVREDQYHEYLILYMDVHYLHNLKQRRIILQLKCFLMSKLEYKANITQYEIKILWLIYIANSKKRRKKKAIANA